ncbi:MAG TPA: TetR/AcrR family transcriptional regulator [Pseudonocardiaceae bacterium]|jgi:AcrR family transcriptional regulator|nr:TetR/AcrR family transcriptional regulator [Pseudonocardiaceae bacterium]
MVDEKMGRKYELRQRADAMAATRRRIAEATIELHGSIGPARTTIAGIAALAGVQRHTVYRHFPTDEDLFAACSTQYWEQHPWPDPQGWSVIEPATTRLAVALGDLYAFYTAVAPMLSNVLRDAEAVPVAARTLQPYHVYLDQVIAVLTAAFPVGPDGQPILDAAVRHATAFGTWQSLAGQQRLATADAITLMTAMIQGTQVAGR